MNTRRFDMMTALSQSLEQYFTRTSALKLVVQYLCMPLAQFD